ncbi:gasdermin-E [Megalops cyprinoides]|uniref:gasdermin-E n=1 Tax=Megalops cyprinoides TaxID=118141 RepID=UPI001863BAE4|nr:gasdermin-E [Megalops cyprinoides]
MFAKATGNFVRQIDPEGCLIPVTRLNNSDKLNLLSLVIKRNRLWFWQRPKYLPSDFTLSDVLDGDTPINPGVEESDFLRYEGTFRDTVSGKLEAGAGQVNLSLEGRGSSKLQSSFGNLKKQEADVQKLLQDCRDRVLNLDHRLLRQTRGRQRDVVAVLKERIVSTQPCSISQQVKELSTCGAMLGLLGPGPVQVSVQENGSVGMDSNISMEIPAGTVLAYSLIELEVKLSGQFELCLQPDTPGGFEVDGRTGSRPQNPLAVVSEMDMVDGMGSDPGREPIIILQKDLQGLKVHFQQLADLPVPTRSKLFLLLKEVLLDREVLTMLEGTLNEWLSGETPSVGQLEELSPAQRGMVRELLDLLQLSGLKGAGQDQTDSPAISPLLTAMHLLISAVEEMSDAVLSLLAACYSPPVLRSLRDLVNGLMVNGESALADEGVCQRAEQLLSSSNVTLRKEMGRLRAETGRRPGLRPLIMCVVVHGLAALAVGG